MPSRPRTHVLEDLAHAALRRAFAKRGWTTEALGEDYGEDFLVRIFTSGEPTPYTFYVQSKATNTIERYTLNGGTILSYPIDTKHLLHWERFWEPVILTVYDSNSGRTYWRVVQPWLEQLDAAVRNRVAKAKSARVTVPTDNRLTGAGLSRIASYTEHRFNRFHREQIGAKHLLESLKDAIGLDISYDPQSGILMIPNGSFVRGDGGARYFFFGKIGALLSELAERAGKSEEQTLHEAIMRAASAVKGMSKRELAEQRKRWPTVDDA